MRWHVPTNVGRTLYYVCICIWCICLNVYTLKWLIIFFRFSIQPANILMTPGNNDIKISDFGLARYIASGNQVTSLEGQVEFMSPEVIALQPLTTAADIWSLGTIVYLM